MCLFINKKIHKGRNGFHKPRVAKHNILVYKILELFDDGSKATPYQYLPIEFKGGRCHLKTDKMVDSLYFVKDTDNDGCHLDKVGEAIHGFYGEDRTKEEMRIGRHNDWNFKKYYAVIPKGAQYWVGQDNDICSSEMIIFASQKSLDKYSKDNNKVVTLNEELA